MRNLKRALSLALAAAMLISLMVVGASAASYGDEASINNTEAVDFLTSLGVVGGDQNGNYNPTATLTRAEFCVMIANALTGGSFDRTLFEGTATPFTDVANHWGAAYIAYCYSVGVIAGTSATTFSPDNTLTAAQASAILLSALGYNQNGEFAANGQFELNVTRWAQQAGLYDELSVSANAGITRDQTAKLIYNAMNVATPVTYSTLVGAYTTSGYDALSGVVLRGDSNTPVAGFPYTLSATVFDLLKVKGYVTDASYNENTDKYTYTVNYTSGNSTGHITGTGVDLTVDSTTEMNDAIGMYVEALYKVETDGTRTAYGLISAGNEVSATWGELDLGTNKADEKVTLAGTTYTTDGTETGISVYTLTNNTIGANGTLGGTYDPASYLTLVDDDKDGKYEYAVLTPVSVAKVTYVGNTSITAGAVYTYEDNTVASGLAKDDFVKIVAAENTVDDKAVVTEIDVIQGTISAMKNTNEVQIDGVWYKLAANTGSTPAVGNTVALAVVGNHYYNVKTIEGKTLDNVIMVLDAGNIDSGIGKGVEAKVMNAGDGAISTITVSKVNDKNATESGANYNSDGYVMVGAMYTFVEKNGAMELTRLANNVIGNSSYAGQTTFDKDGLDGDPAVGNRAIADDAVVLVYSGSNDKSAYITGADLKNWKVATWGTYGQILYSSVNGVPTATVVALYDSGATIPGSVGSTGYGYVIADSYYVEEDNTGYAVMTIWTEDGQITVRAEGYGASNTTPTATTVTTQADLKKGAFVSFENLSNGNISNVTAVGSEAALTGMRTNSDGDTVLTLVGISGNKVVDEDTQIIYVDTNKKAGAEGGELALAAEAAIAGNYIENVVVYDSNSDGVLEAVFADVNNNLASNKDSVTPATGTYITSVTEGTDKNELKIANAATGAQVATEAAAWAGALAAQVIDNTGAVKTTGAVATTDTLRVVAEDGTVFTYVINSIAGA